MIHLVCLNPALDRTLLVDRLRPGLPNRPHAVKEDAGGKSFNVMRSLEAQQCTEKILIHAILGGTRGQYIEELSRQKNWRLAVTATETNTRECTIIVQENDRSLYPIYERGARVDGDTLGRFKASLHSRINPGDTVIFSGSLMRGIPSEFLGELTAEFRKRHVCILADTSGAALSAVYHATPCVLKINDEELGDLFPKLSISEALRIANPDIRYFIVTAGSRGVWARIEKTIYRVHVPAVKVRNPVASGDFFLGVIARHFLNEAIKPSELLKKASAYATANCLSWFPEADPHTAAELEGKITVEIQDPILNAA